MSQEHITNHETRSIPDSIAVSQATAGTATSDTEKFCNQATHNVLIGYNQAKQGTTMLELMTAYPEHKQEILAGYKLYELGKGSMKHITYSKNIVCCDDWCVVLANYRSINAMYNRNIKEAIKHVELLQEQLESLEQRNDRLTKQLNTAICLLCSNKVSVVKNVELEDGSDHYITSFCLQVEALDGKQSGAFSPESIRIKLY